MKKEWKFFNTNYRQAWIDYRKTLEYEMLSESLKSYGIKQPYRNNIIKNAFAAGFRASGVGIKQIKP